MAMTVSKLDAVSKKIILGQKTVFFWLKKGIFGRKKDGFGYTEPKNGCQPLNIVIQRVPGIIQYHHQSFALEDDSEFFLNEISVLI